MLNYTSNEETVVNLICVSFVENLNSSLITENIEQFTILQQKSQYIFEHSVAFDQKYFFSLFYKCYFVFDTGVTYTLNCKISCLKQKQKHLVLNLQPLFFYMS